RLDHPRQRELEIVSRWHARIMAHQCRRPEAPMYLVLGVWAPPPRLTAQLGLVRAGLFSVENQLGPQKFCRGSANMRQHFLMYCGGAGSLPLGAPSLRGSDESYAGGSRANYAATPPGSAGRRYRPTMRAFSANG